MNKREIGEKYETQAVEYLKSQGFSVLKRNFRNRIGEIDIIALEGEMLCFVEVKYRKDHRYGYPEEAVTPNKQRVIRQVSQYYMGKEQISENRMIRYDIVAISKESIRLIRNAF